MNATEEKLIQVIANHYLTTGGGKITLEQIARSAGISRQALNKFYPHLKLYAQGRRPIAELLPLEGTSNSALLLKSQNTIDNLRLELDRVVRKQESDIRTFKMKYVTSLMNDDIVAHSSNETRLLAEKKGLHVDSLIKEVSHLKSQLILMQEKLETDTRANVSNDLRCETIDVPIDLWSAYDSFVKSGDIDALENEKLSKCTAAISKIKNKLKKGGDVKVCIFVERYIFNYKDFLKIISPEKSFIIYCLRLPIHSRVELKSLRSLFDSSARIEVYIPVTASIAIAKATRAFLFRDVPDSEFLAADKMDFPIIKDGFSKVIFFDIERSL